MRTRALLVPTALEPVRLTVEAVKVTAAVSMMEPEALRLIVPEVTVFDAAIVMSLDVPVVVRLSM